MVQYIVLEIENKKRQLIEEYASLHLNIASRIRQLSKSMDKPDSNGFTNDLGDIQHTHTINALCGKITTLVEIYRMMSDEPTTKDSSVKTN